MSLRKRGTLYFGTVGGVLSGAVFLFMNQGHSIALKDLILVFGGAFSGMILGMAMGPLFFSSEKKSVWKQRIRSVIVGAVLGILAWPLTGFFSGLGLAILDWLSGAENLGNILSNAFKLSIIYGVVAITPLGWVVIFLVALSGVYFVALHRNGSVPNRVH